MSCVRPYSSISNRYMAKHNYSAAQEDELSFGYGDVMRVTSQHDDGWWSARLVKTGNEGEVPSNYVAEFKSVDEKQ